MTLFLLGLFAVFVLGVLALVLTIESLGRWG